MTLSIDRHNVQKRVHNTYIIFDLSQLEYENILKHPSTSTSHLVKYFVSFLFFTKKLIL